MTCHKHILFFKKHRLELLEKEHDLNCYKSQEGVSSVSESVNSK